MAVQLTYELSHGQQETRIGAIVTGVESRADIFAALLGAIPLSYDGLIFSRLESAEQVEGQTDVWKCRLLYGSREEKKELQEGDSEFRFSSATRQITRTLSIASRCYELDEEGATVQSSPDDIQIIGFNRADGPPRAEGVQVTEYLNAFSWRVAVPFSTASESWRRSVGRLRGSVCNGRFFGYDAKTVKFEDISGAVKGAELYEFDLSFQQIDNPGTINIGGITVPNVLAWELLDVDQVSWKTYTAPGGRKRLVPAVARVKIHQMFPYKSWALLSDLLGV